VRARATQVIESAVFYGAHTILQRGYIIRRGGHVFINGEGNLVSRYLDAPVAEAQAAHLVSGYRDLHAARNSMLLSQISLKWYNDNKPSWWPSDAAYADVWRTMPNNTNPTGDGLFFWADVCGSFCVRQHGDDAEFMDLDFTILGAEAHENGRCACYAYQDVQATDGAHPDHAQYANLSSHAAPNDVRAIEFLSRHVKIAANQDNNTHVFAIHRAPAPGYFVPELQSTVYHRQLWSADAHIDIGLGTIFNVFDATRLERIYGVGTLNNCLARCGIHAVSNTRELKTIRFSAVDQSCFCFTLDLFEWTYEGLWIRDEGSSARWYQTTYCEFVRPDTVGRSLVWSKDVTPPAKQACVGSPAAAGYVIQSGSVLESFHDGESSTPFDVKCQWACQNDTQCQYAHVFMETFQYLDAIHQRDPPPRP
jgi:hypothetical protein